MRQDHHISVRPVPGGWRVALDDFQPLMFLSGRKAETHARALATRMAEIGDRACVTVHDRAHTLIGNDLF